MLTVLLLSTALLARDDAERHLDALVEQYVTAILVGTGDAERLSGLVGQQQFALRLHELRQQLTEQHLRSEIRRLRAESGAESELRRLEDELHELRCDRELYLARRTETERQQLAAIAAAEAVTPRQP